MKTIVEKGMRYQSLETVVDLSEEFDSSLLHYEIVKEPESKPRKENTLYLTIAGEYFEQILAGTKDKEFRELKETVFGKYIAPESEPEIKLRADCPDMGDKDAYDEIYLYHNGYFGMLPRRYEYLKLAVGYAKDRDWAIVELKAISIEPVRYDDGKPIRYTLDPNVPDEEAFCDDGEACTWLLVYHLGKPIEQHSKGKGKTDAKPNIQAPAIDYQANPSMGIRIVDPKGEETEASTAPKRNFDFLKGVADFAPLYRLCNEAEIYQYADPGKSALSARKALEYLVKSIYMLKGFDYSERASLFELVDRDEFKNFIKDYELLRNLHFIRKAGNIAAHDSAGTSRQESFFCVLNLYNLVGSLLMMLGVIDIFPRFDNSLLPKKPELHLLPAPRVEPKPELIDKYQERAQKQRQLVLKKEPKYLSEAETRALYINQMLREAGWKVLETQNAIVANSAAIEIAVKGMPNNTGEGFVDYVLFGADSKPLALIEAKKTAIDASSGKHQAELYAECLEKAYGRRPVVYYSNGYEIYCIDQLGYPPRRLYAFHSREDLELLMQRRERKAISDLSINNEITGRAYQKQAITAICEHFNKMHRRALLVMATGTGKTRTAISLVDVLQRNGWVKNVLFLADRTSLVKQAASNFSKHLPQVTNASLSENANPDRNARVLLSTYQTMINYIDSDTKEFSIGRFDLIILDEAHRSIFGKYAAIFKYFDGFLVGLTATPRDEVDRSTYEIFGMEQGEPNFAYELDEAVSDGFLVPYRVINRKSKILEGGIKYSELSQEEKEELEKVFEYEGRGERDIEDSEIFKYLFNSDTVDRVLQDLMDNGKRIEGGEKIGKSIIFAYNHQHAEQIVKRFHALYPDLGAEFCVLIDHTVKYAQDLIDRFTLRDKEPQIAVSVDMLDTGIDVPDALNLVFFKRVKSKIKFQQMIGRGTRLSEDIFGAGKDKEEFLIFDYCGNFEYFGEKFKEAKSQRQVSLSEKIFCQKLKLAKLLQTDLDMADDYSRNMHGELKAGLLKQVQGLNRNFISVRQELELVDRYSIEKCWEYIDDEDLKDLSERVAPLLAASKGQEQEKRFDLLILQLQESLLDEGIDPSPFERQLTFIVSSLIEKASIAQIAAKMPLLRRVQSCEFWDELSLSSLEHLRIEIRDLMKFLNSEESRTFEVNVDDELQEGKEVGAINPIKTYRQRVLDYLSEHSETDLIQKIKELKQLKQEDIQELERVLWEELGSKEDYEKMLRRDSLEASNVAIFIRSIVGIEKEKALELFSAFIDKNTLNQMQLEYLKQILDYVSKNGDINGNVITNMAPFKDYDWQAVFGSNIRFVGDFVKELHALIQPA